MEISRQAWVDGSTCSRSRHNVKGMMRGVLTAKTNFYIIGYKYALIIYIVRYQGIIRAHKMKLWQSNEGVGKPKTMGT